MTDIDDTTIDNEEDFELSELPDDELVKQMQDDLYDGLKEEIEEGTRRLDPHRVAEALLRSLQRRAVLCAPYERHECRHHDDCRLPHLSCSCAGGGLPATAGAM